MGKEPLETGTFKLPKDGGDQERVASIPGLDAALDKMNEGAKLNDLDELEQRKIQINAYRDDESRILAAIGLDKTPNPEIVRKDFGVLGDMRTVFALVAEQVGSFNRNEHKTVTFKDLAIWKTKGNYKEGYEPDYDHVDVKATYENIERLKAIKAIRPLVFQG